MLVAAIVLAVIGVLLQALFIIAEHKSKFVSAVVLKGCASLMFVFVGALSINTITNGKFGTLVLIGLILGACGDVLLNLRFVFPKLAQKIFLVGVAVFLSGHILYLVALIPLSQSLFISLPVGAVIAAAVLVWIFTSIKGLKLAYKIFGIVYIGAVCLMTAVAVGILIATPSVTSLLYAIGAILFTVSDVVLIFNSFGPQAKFSLRITNLTLYYVGQLLIAFCLFFC